MAKKKSRSDAAAEARTDRASDDAAGTGAMPDATPEQAHAASADAASDAPSEDPGAPQEGDPPRPAPPEPEPEPAPAAEKKMGTSKAVETMFKNAYRAELDTIALAATKANIMISLNGFIISALMISGAFIFASSPAFLLPAGVFLITAASSIVFALLSASPERADLLRSVAGWARAVAGRRARLRDLRAHVLQARQATPSDRVNILIYEDRVRLTREDYWQKMQDLIGNREQVYYSMSDQLYWLGAMADRKFRLLNLSYTVFRWGLLVSLVSFLALKSVLGILATRSGTADLRLRNLGIGAFEQIYEPSAVQQLPDGRLLVVEDEATRAMSVLTIGADGALAEDKATGTRLMRGMGRKMSDLEGLSLDDAGNVYAVTSHSLTNEGERKADREQLLRFQVSGASIGAIRSVGGLRDAMAGDAGLRAAIEARAGQAPDFSDLNIEGLAYHVPTGRLYLGLRDPRAGEASLIVVIDNPDRMFETGEAPRFGDPVLLDLRGGGIRALSYDPVLGSFLIVNEIEGYENNRYSQLWSWSGNPDHAPEPVALPDIINLNNVESIDSIMVQGVPHILLMSDEGSEKKNEPARYMMLDYGQLKD
ncbi:Pycsar system effector family protein [Paracoccus spongiarum]|uniref:DUF5706 domain-containing protein n=1 Tax=Paracoccus spongiarum TaxID=3064387 RepID=A0ABT9JEL7_9RHOB|nr:Pycsar system effector family protein [Paracoccus sp. 2205BS29-5]MDP5308204.1 DUF5706 domain-containing protein [Paracoccus sp. 2205BS29-5]